MFIFIVYGVGPRHCQNMGCSKSTAKAQLWDTPLVKLTDAKVGKPLHLPSLLSCCHLPLPDSGLLLALPLAQRSPTAAPRLWKGSHLTHISLQEGSWAVLPQSQGSSALRISWEQAVHLRKWAKTLSWLNPPQLFPEPKDFPPAAIFTTHQHELAADNMKKLNKT